MAIVKTAIAGISSNITLQSFA